jgi:hypothetical protein
MFTDTTDSQEISGEAFWDAFDVAEGSVLLGSANRLGGGFRGLWRGL